jgi:hypothetical protein
MSPTAKSWLLLFIQALKRELGQEEGTPGLLRNSLIKTAAPKHSQTKSKRRSKRVDDIEN